MPISNDIAQAFASGVTILTANARAARWLHREYAVRARLLGRKAWATPPIFDWESWLNGLWQEQALEESSAPLLLTSLQEQSVWTQVQRHDSELVVSPDDLAATSQSAYALLGDYCAHAELGRNWGTGDSERFRRWATEFDRECKRHNWLPRAKLEERLTKNLPSSNSSPEMLLVGFERVTPAQDRLIEAVRNSGVAIRFSSAPAGAAALQLMRSPNLREELFACAQWVRSTLESNPDARIGVLVPDLGAVRAEMGRIFRRVLMPQSDDIFKSNAMPFEFSLGQPLAGVPAVKSALLLLRWLHSPLREEAVTFLLLSGFLSSTTMEVLELARLDVKVRKSLALSPEISLSRFLSDAGYIHSRTIANLQKVSQQASSNRISNEDRLPGRWADIASLLLREAGWPGAASSDTLHFQVIRRWEGVLDEISLLDFDEQRMSYENFLRTLEYHASNTVFSPQSKGAPVQIMGALEAAGQQFDATWFLGADDASWPSRGSTNPLLPEEMQRRYRMPHAESDDDLKFARIVTERIAGSAPLVVFSYSMHDRDGDLRPSPLLPSSERWNESPTMPESANSVAIDTIDEPSVEIPWSEARLAGGSEVLRDQAACPFRAFAFKRLNAEPLNRRDWGLSAAERGKLLHKALEYIWSPNTGVLHSITDLRNAINSGTLSKILQDAISRAFLSDAPPSNGDEWFEAYLLNERKRLQLRLSEWMELEAQRASFRVKATEVKLPNVHVGALKLNLRADRVDELSGGKRLLIDYKSGDVSPRQWESSRLQEPQLPLYALFGNVENVCGVVFGRIRAGATAFVGSVEDLNQQLFPNTNPKAALGKMVYTEHLQDEWRDSLIAIAESFLRGDAAVDPVEGPATCKYCPLPGLCRVAEIDDARRETGLEDDDSAE